MTRTLLALAVVCSAFSVNSARAEMVARKNGNRLEIHSGAAGTERFEVRALGDLVYLLYDNEFDNDDELEYWNDWEGIETIHFFGDDDRDEFWNMTNLRSYQSGGRGDDFLVGGSNHDKLYGELGKDSLWGMAGDDWLDAGIDVIEGVVYGDDGDDTLIHHHYTLKGHPFSSSPSASFQIISEQQFDLVDLSAPRDPYAMDEIRRPGVDITSAEYREMMQYYQP